MAEASPVSPPRAATDEFVSSLDGLPVEAILLDPVGAVLAANTRWAEGSRSRSQGDGLGSFIGHPLSEVMLGSDSSAPDSVRVFEGIMAVVGNRDRSFVGEYRTGDSASASAAVQVQASAVEQGGERRVLVTRIDVVDGQSLEQRCEELHVALQRANEFIFFVEPSGALKLANERLRRILKRPKDDWEGLSLWDICPDFNSDQWRTCLEELRELGTLSMRSSFLTQESVTFPVELVAKYFDTGGETVFFYGRESSGQAIDSTGFRFRQRLREKTSRLEAFNTRLQSEMANRIETENKLRESQDRLELAIWATELGLWDWRLAQDRLSLDQRALTLLGLEADLAAFSMDRLRARIHRDDQVGFDNRLERHLRGDTDGLDSIHRMIQADGSFRWYQVQGRASDRNDEGLVQRMIGTVQDVSERKALEDELLQSQKMEAIGRLAGGVAHDFNNLLTAINGYSDLVLRTLEDGSPHRGRIEEINKAGQRAAVLTNRLLSFGRKQIQQPEPLELSATIRELKPLLIPALGEDIELMLDLQDVPRVRADLHQVEQAILNLVVNGRDAMPKGGLLAISVREVQASPRVGAPPTSHVRISVKDEGLGIDESIREHIFEPFFTTKASGDGSGLGLPMVYGLVRQCDGLIEIESAPGAGTAFHLYFPVVEENLDSSVEHLRVQAEPSLRGEGSLLLVEDEDAVRNLVRETLTEQGYSVVAVGSADQALEAVAKAGEPFDMLVTDVVLGGTTGVELARMLRESRPGLPVLFVSGYAEHAVDGALTVEPGMAFLRKPFLADKLYEHITHLLRWRTSRQKREGSGDP